MKKIIAIIMVAVFAFSAMSVSANADNNKNNINKSEITVTTNGIDFIFEAGTSEETIDKIISDYFNPCNDAQPYGITCTLLGHNIELTRTYVVTHNASSTAPRCLKKTYNVETCTRCDYVSKTLLNQSYIYCC